MDKVLLKVEGMDCANCALTISRTLSREGLKNVSVDFITGEVSFDNVPAPEVSNAVLSIDKLGYTVVDRSDEKGNVEEKKHTHAEGSARKFYFSLVFTIPLLLHMFLPFALLHNPYFQLLLATPVMFIGIIHFGSSAWHSVRAGVPNMDVLIIIGSSAAFIYSVAGMILYGGTPEVHKYLFFETSASIITLVLLGGLIEKRSVRQTTGSIAQLGKLQPRFANKVVSKDAMEDIVQVDVAEIVPGDLVSLKSGDRIPADGILIHGKILVDESMLSGESLPVEKFLKDEVTGGTFVQQGHGVFSVKSAGKNSVLSQIIEIVKQAQHSRPEIQKLGDRISAIFVPVVLGISLLTFLISWLGVNMTAQDSLMHSIAVLVISCPCAMGLATPTAVMVGLGRAARNGILIKGGSTIEQLSTVKTIVFDKTGTLTTGDFRIRRIESIGVEESEIKSLLYSIQRNSSHPIARAITRSLEGTTSSKYEWKEITEDKGVGMNAIDVNGNLYSVGSYKMVKHFYEDLSHDLYVLKNNKLIGYLDIEDEVKKDAGSVIAQLKSAGYRVVMLSGDRKVKCDYVAERTGIEEVYSEKLPAEKLKILEHLSKENPVAMVGDGINDAPSLSRADVGISLSNASDIAIQSAQIVLLSQNDFDVLLKALRIGKMTYQTIKQNLFWAFFYNVVAIPVAAVGLLSPAVAALSMAFSDVIVIGNSLRLRTRKIEIKK